MSDNNFENEIKMKVHIDFVGIESTKTITFTDEAKAINFIQIIKSGIKHKEIIEYKYKNYTHYFNCNYINYFMLEKVQK